MSQKGVSHPELVFWLYPVLQKDVTLGSNLDGKSG